MSDLAAQVSKNRHEIVAHHILRLGSLVETNETARAFLSIQGRGAHEIMGKLPQKAVDNPSFNFSLLVIQRLIPASAFPLHILHDADQEDPLTFRFSGIAPSRNDQDCLKEVIADLDFLESVPGLNGVGAGEVYVIGKEPLNVSDRIATLHAATPEAALLKFIAVVYPGISADYRAIEHIELEGLAMRRLDDWSSFKVEKLWSEAKKNLLDHVSPRSEPEPDFDF